MSDTARDILSRTGVLKHYNDGTRPEESSAVVRGGIVENKGYNPPPPPSEKEEAPAPEEAKAAEVEAAASEADSAEAPKHRMLLRMMTVKQFLKRKSHDGSP